MFTGERNILFGCGIFRAGAEYSVRVRDIPCGCRIFRAGAKYSVQPLAVSALPLELFRRAPSIFHIALNLIPIVSGDSKPLRRDWSQQEIDIFIVDYISDLFYPIFEKPQCRTDCNMYYL